MATSKSRRQWLYACLLVAGVAHAPLFHRLVTPSDVEPEPVASAQRVEEEPAVEREAAPEVALLGTQLSESNYPAQLMADSPRDEAPAQGSASSGGLPSTVALLGGGGAAPGGAYGGAGGGGMPGRGSPGFAGGGGGGGAPGLSRPNGPAPAAPMAAPARPSNAVSKPQPRLLLAGGPESRDAMRVADNSARPSALDIRAPIRPSDDPDMLPNISSPRDASQPQGSSPRRPLEGRGTRDEDDTSTEDPTGVLDAIDSNIASGLHVTETLHGPGTGQLGPALAEVEQRIADGTAQLVVTGVGSPSGQTGRESAAPGNLEPLASLIDANQVPEPMTLALLALGVGLLGATAQRRVRA